MAMDRGIVGLIEDSFHWATRAIARAIERMGNAVHGAAQKTIAFIFGAQQPPDDDAKGEPDDGWWRALRRAEREKWKR